MNITIKPSNKQWVNPDGSQASQVSEYVVELTREEVGKLIAVGNVYIGNIFVLITKEK